MKMLHLIVALAWTSVVLAEQTIDAWTLGQMQGTLEVCSAVSPQDAAQYLLQMKALIGNATKDMVDEARRTADYQQAYQSTRSDLTGMTPASRASACKAGLATSD